MLEPVGILNGNPWVPSVVRVDFVKPNSPNSSTHSPSGLCFVT